ncbi:MAG: hypothetical protein RLZZ261_415 [Bacteroidota bacterium]|jgi:hypothetical protein
MLRTGKSHKRLSALFFHRPRLNLRFYVIIDDFNRILRDNVFQRVVLYVFCLFC